jgi:OPA family sugar phosphate sensor protein UhpC-like MFS transporter
VATLLSPAHRAWRARVFVATWLGYAGFYFCRKPFSAAKSAIGETAHWSPTTLGNIGAAYFIAYAVGQYLASYMGTRLGPRRNVLLGMALSITVTLGMTQTLDARVMTVLMAVLGLAQATGWSGSVGTMAGWFHKHERGRVMGAWSTNFNVGSLASGWLMAWVLGLATPAPWRWCFYAGAIVLGVMLLQFFVLQRNRPEDVGLTPVDDPAPPEDGGLTPVDDSTTPVDGSAVPRARVVRGNVTTGFMGLSRDAWINLLLVGGFYFFAKFIRYAIWSWAPYFLHEHYGLAQGSANFQATAFDLLGLPGVYVTGWMSDRLFASRRSGIAALMMVGVTLATLALLLLRDASSYTVVTLLAAIGFMCFGPDALLTGAGAIDIGGANRATFAAGVISGIGSMGAIVQELVIANLYDAKTQSLTVVFALLLGSSALAAAFCLALVVRNRRGGRGI